MASKTPGKPSLSLTEAERVRAALERLYEGEFMGNKTALGKALGISQPAVTQLLDGTNKASLDTAKAAARLEGVQLTRYLDETASDPENAMAPSKQRAASAARQLGFPEWAVERMLADEAPAGSDPGVMYWFRRIEMLAAETPAQAPQPSRGATGVQRPTRARRAQ